MTFTSYVVGTGFSRACPAVVGAAFRRACIALLALPFLISDAHAQEFMVRGFADLGTKTFAAEEGFEAITGKRSAPVFGGGGEIVLPQGIFASVRASRIRTTGERVFVFNDEVFRLGIPVEIAITPIELTGGYRFDFKQRVVPFAGGGVGWHRYEESSDFAENGENVRDTHTGYHVLGGVEVRLARWFGIAGEAQWTTVRDALGSGPNGVAAQFGENDLGGRSFRVKVVIGR